MTTTDKPSRLRRVGSLAFFVTGLALLVTAVLLLRITMVTDYLYHATVKDPERTPPAGNVIVAPADGSFLSRRTRLNRTRNHALIRKPNSAPRGSSTMATVASATAASASFSRKSSRPRDHSSFASHLFRASILRRRSNRDPISMQRPYRTASFSNSKTELSSRDRVPRSRSPRGSVGSGAGSLWSEESSRSRCSIEATTPSPACASGSLRNPRAPARFSHRNCAPASISSLLS